jgi:hypothetical protein
MSQIAVLTPYRRSLSPLIPFNKNTHEKHDKNDKYSKKLKINILNSDIIPNSPSPKHLFEGSNKDFNGNFEIEKTRMGDCLNYEDNTSSVNIKKKISENDEKDEKDNNINNNNIIGIEDVSKLNDNDGILLNEIKSNLSNNVSEIKSQGGEDIGAILHLGKRPTAHAENLEVF